MRRCKETGKRIHATVTAARSYARSRKVGVVACLGCLVRCSDGIMRPGYHVVRS